MDKRKHFTQMTQDEIKFLLLQVRSRRLSFSPHAFDRMNQKNIREPQIIASISYCNIIEAHNNVANEVRVLVRGKVSGDYVCSVISLTRNEVITTYRNKKGDHHQTLDKTAYTWTADLTKLEQKLLGN
jgi:hypothetical protein